MLGDVFSSFSIAIDKPFEVGDYIDIDGNGGTVERVGLKTNADPQPQWRASRRW